MSDFSSVIYGSVSYDIVDKKARHAIGEFISDRSVLDEHVSRKCGHRAAYSLSPGYVSTVAIEFLKVPGQFLNVKESLEVLVSFLRALGIHNVSVDVICVSNNSYGDIEHFKLDENFNVISSPATISFNHYN